MKNDLFEDLAEYIASHFPRGNLQTYYPIAGDIYVRFELGAPFKNGTDERIAQVNYRANSIIEACFSPSDQLLVLIDDLQGENEDPMFGNTTPHYLYDVIGETILLRAEERIVGYLDCPSDTVPEFNFRQLLIPTGLKEIRYKEILAGIANYEQGREPKIGQAVWFISTEKDIAFYMYDDRGCIIFSDSAEKIGHLYEQFSAWLVDSWRDSIDNVFRKKV